jgi:hypothetical protein
LRLGVTPTATNGTVSSHTIAAADDDDNSSSNTTTTTTNNNNNTTQNMNSKYTLLEICDI